MRQFTADARVETSGDRAHGTGRIRRVALALAVAAATLGWSPVAQGQLRPVEPLEWEIFVPGNVGVARVGMGILMGQKAALAGTEGRVLEIGNYAALWRAGRVVLELSGTAARRLDDRRRWAEPAPGVSSAFGAHVDAGDLRALTAVRLSPQAWPVLAVLRFGVRLPSTSAGRGLDRGQTDFLGEAGLAWRRGRLLAAVESGIGILGTRVPEFEQQDDWVYGATVAWEGRVLQPRAVFTGQSSPLRYRHNRGNEDLREVRAGIRAGGKRWVELLYVRGLIPFSPRAGVLLSAGMSLSQGH